MKFIWTFSKQSNLILFFSLNVTFISFYIFRMFDEKKSKENIIKETKLKNIS